MASRRLEHAWIEGNDAPLYVWRTPAQPSQEEVESFCAALRGFLPHLTEPYAMVVDGTKVIRAGAVQRRLLAETLHALSPHINRWCAGNAIVVSNAMVQGVVTAIQWIARPGYPYSIVTDMDEGRRWAVAQLDRARSPASRVKTPR